MCGAVLLSGAEVWLPPASSPLARHLNLAGLDLNADPSGPNRLRLPAVKLWRCLVRLSRLD